MSTRLAVLATAVTVILLPLTATVAFLSLPSPAAWTVFLLAAAQHAVSYWSVSRPTIALLLIAAGAALQALITGLFFLLPSNGLVLTAICVASARGSSAVAIGVALTGSALATIAYASDDSVVESGFGPAPWLLLTLFIALSAVACASGWLWRSQRVAAELIRERDLRDQRERESRAIEGERNRISRDLHDILAHSLAVVISQIRVARFEPDNTEEALATAEATARSSLAELRQTLGALRETRPDDRTASAKIDLGHPASLSAAAEAIGVPLSHVVRGTPRTVGEQRRAAIGWLIREALTNAAKHAPGAQVDYAEVWESDRLEISLSNDRAIADGVAHSSGGLGLRGMAERMAEVDGVLSVQSSPRFVVTAVLPFASPLERKSDR